MSMPQRSPSLVLGESCERVDPRDTRWNSTTLSDGCIARTNRSARPTCRRARLIASRRAPSRSVNSLLGRFRPIGQRSAGLVAFVNSVQAFGLLGWPGCATRREPVGQAFRVRLRPGQFQSYGRRQQHPRRAAVDGSAGHRDQREVRDGEDRHPHHKGAHGSGGRDASRGGVRRTSHVAGARAGERVWPAARGPGHDGWERAVSPAARRRRHRGAAGREQGARGRSTGPPSGLTRGSPTDGTAGSSPVKVTSQRLCFDRFSCRTSKSGPVSPIAVAAASDLSTFLNLSSPVYRCPSASGGRLSPRAVREASAWLAGFSWRFKL